MSEPNRHDIINTVAQVCGVTAIELFGRDKKRRPTMARQMAAYFLRKSGLSLPKAGAALGDMHHTTVLHAVRLIDRKPQQFEPHLSEIASALSVPQ